MPLLCTIHRLYGNFRRYCTESICQFLGQNSHTTISSNLHAWLFNAVRFSSLTKVQRERYFSLDEMEEESYSPIDDFYDEEELLQKRNQLLTELKKLPEQEYNVLVKLFWKIKSTKK